MLTTTAEGNLQKEKGSSLLCWWDQQEEEGSLCLQKGQRDKASESNFDKEGRK